MSFWALLYQLIHHVGGCVAAENVLNPGGPERFGPPGLPTGIVYGGNCIQAFWIAVWSHGTIAWEYLW